MGTGYPFASNCADRDSTNFCSGLQPYVISDAFDMEKQRHDLITLLPRSVYWTQKLHKVLSVSISSLMNNIFISGHETGQGPIGALVDTFDDQLLDVSRLAADEISMPSK
jgi:hypothetical protein